MTKPTGVNLRAGIVPFRIAVEQSPFLENADQVRFDQDATLIAHALNSIRATTTIANSSIARMHKHLGKAEYPRIVDAAHTVVENREAVVNKGISLRTLEEMLRPDEKNRIGARLGMRKITCLLPIAIVCVAAPTVRAASAPPMPTPANKPETPKKAAKTEEPQDVQLNVVFDDIHDYRRWPGGREDRPRSGSRPRT